MRRETDFSQSKPFLPIDGVCARYGISRTTQWRWSNDPDIGFPAPAMQVAGRPFWNIEDIERWEASRANLPIIPRGRHREVQQ